MADVFSPLVNEVVRTKRTDLPARAAKVQAVMIHTTGSGLIANALKAGKDVLAYYAAYYARADAYASGSVVGWEGKVVGTVPDNLIAYHAGVSKTYRAIYAKGTAVWRRHVLENGKLVDKGVPQPHYEDWLARWPTLKSPLDLLTGPGVNSVTIGLDLLAPVAGAQHGETQLQKMAALIREIAGRQGIVVKKETVLRHSDIDPFSRSTSRGGWDPPRSAFERLCTILGFDAWPRNVS